MDKSITSIDGVVIIGRDLYIKTPDALKKALAKLRKLGYKIKDLRQDESRSGRHNVTVETMEKEGWSLWYASLPDLRREVCGSCNRLMSTFGSRCHGHRCEHCGVVTYYDIVDGSTVRFSFIQRDESDRRIADVKMTARRWDTEAGYLYLYPELLDGLWLRAERLKEYFDANADKWERVTEDGLELIRIRYPERSERTDENVVISMSEVYGHYFNSTTVRVWKGKRYSEFDFSDKLPLQESMSVFETWHWAPLSSSPQLHERLIRAIHQVSDKGYYYQDGRPAFTRAHLAEMGRFVREFTTLDADAWRAQSRLFRLDGPGCIEDVAEFCHPNPTVKDRPNMFNALSLVGKVSAGGRVSRREVEAAAIALKDPEETETLFRIVGGMLRSR